MPHESAATASAPGDVVLRCDHLVRFHDTPAGRVQAVRGVDLEVTAGAVVAIVGPSGSGKSSLLRMLAGLDRPTAGTVDVEGHDLWAMSDRRRARYRASVLTHLFQRPDDNLFHHLTAEMHLDRLAPVDADQDVVAEWLETVGLTARRHHLPEALSGGERQRLAFACAAVAGHRVVVADEPTSQLDGSAAHDVMDAVAELSARGVAVVFSTHDHRVLDRVDEVVTLRDGAIASTTTADGELAVIDRSGRVQLPPEVLERFPTRRARLVVDDDGHIELWRP